MPITFRKAERGNSQILVGLFGGTGTGKTFSALLLARGIAGPDGKIGIADSEGGRGLLFADVPSIGGYDYAELTQPFTPDEYIQAIDAAEKAKLDVLVIDSMSHEWHGIGGVLEMAEKNGKSLNAWRLPKMAHQRLIARILSTKLHLVLCFRAKRKTRQIGQGTNAKVAKDDFYTPQTSDDFLFELLAVAEVVNDPHHVPHSLRVLKTTHPDVAPFFKTGIVITTQTGALFSAWSKKSKTLGKAIEKAAEEQTKIAAGAKVEPPRNEPSGSTTGEEDDPPPFVPPGGWPKFERLGDWGTWSEKFLKTASRPVAEAWQLYFTAYHDAISEKKSAGDQRAIDLDKKLKPLFVEAMKREPPK